jgi:hypothetical protein
MPEDSKEPDSQPTPTPGNDGEPAVPPTSGSPLDLPKPKSKIPLYIALAVILITVTGSLIYNHIRYKKWEEEWARLGPMEPSGGLPLYVRINVPLFRQSDDRWRKEKLAGGKTTLGQEGCAVSSAAMVLASYGVDTDPGRLNKALTENDGFENSAWIKWESAAEVTGNVARKAYEDQPSFRLIDEQLQRGNPVIVRLRNQHGTHFVVIAGKEGYDYLIQDPGAGGAKGLYPLREYGSKVEALRFYERLK